MQMLYCAPISTTQVLEKISIQLPWKFQFEFAGYIAAKELGYYEDAGLDVSLKELVQGDQNIVDDVLNNRSDYGVSDNDITQDPSNPPIVLLANYFKRSALVIISHDLLLTPDKLANTHIMASENDIRSGSIHLLLKKFNVDSKTITIIPQSFDVNDFISGKITIATAYLSNEMYILRKKKIPFSIIDPNAYGIYSYNNNLFSSKKTAKNHYYRTQKLINATNKGWQYALKHPKEISQLIYQKYSQKKSLKALIFEANTIKSLVLADIYPIGSYDKDFIRKNIDTLISYQLIDPSYSLDGLFFDQYKPSQLHLNSTEQTFLTEHPKIIVSNELGWYPYDFTDNETKSGLPMGYSVDYLKLLADRIGVNLEFYSAHWYELLNKIQTKDIDALNLVSKNRQRERYLALTKPVLSIQYSLISLDPELSLSNLNGKILALGKNWSITTAIKAQYPNIKILEVNTSKQMLEAVAFGQADAAIDDFQTATYLKKSLFFNQLNIKKIQQGLVQSNVLSLGFRKDLAMFVPIFEKAMASITASESHKLKEKWFDYTKEQTASKSNKEITNTLFNSKELSYLKAKKEITYCIDPDWMPLEKLLQGKHIGMTADYFNLFKAIIPIPITLVPTGSWSESVNFAKQRRCDIFSLAMPTDERKKYMNFTHAYLDIPLVIATQNKEPFIANITLITDKKIGIVKDYAFGEILKKRYPKMQIVAVKSLQDGLEKVNKGQLFGFVGTLSTVGYTIQKQFTGELKIAGKFDETWQLGIATRNDQPQLNRIFNKAIASINPESQQKILNKWIAVRFEKGMDYQAFFQLIALFVVIASLILYRNYTLEKYNKQLEKLATTDKLTQLYNRQKIDQTLEYQVAYNKRYGHTFSIIIIDIDFFKQVNDHYGHLVGDSVLIEIADILKHSIRTSDIVGRWGGEEFLIICPHSSAHEAGILAEKIRFLIANYHFTSIEKTLTASFGVAQYHNKEMSIQTLVRLADNALYQAKDKGRNQVVCHTEQSNENE